MSTVSEKHLPPQDHLKRLNAAAIIRNFSDGADYQAEYLNIACACFSDEVQIEFSEHFTIYYAPHDGLYECVLSGDDPVWVCQSYSKLRIGEGHADMINLKRRFTVDELVSFVLNFRWEDYFSLDDDGNAYWKDQ